MIHLVNVGHLRHNRPMMHRAALRGDKRAPAALMRCRSRALTTAVLVLSVGAITGCAPAPAGTVDSPSVSSGDTDPTPNRSPGVASPTTTDPAEAADPPEAPAAPPAPTAPPVAEGDPAVPPAAVYNGEVLIITADVVGQMLEVTAMVPGVSEDTGSCTLEVPDRGLSANVMAVPGNDVTYCGVMSVPVGPSDSGEWSIRVNYSSPSHRAQSADLAVTVGS